MYKALLHNKALKYYESLDDKKVKKINKSIEAMKNNPLEGQHIKRLKGIHEGKHRYATGDIRIVYRVNEDEKIILIEAIGPRGDIYKQ